MCYDTPVKIRELAEITYPQCGACWSNSVITLGSTLLYQLSHLSQGLFGSCFLFCFVFETDSLSIAQAGQEFH